MHVNVSTTERVLRVALGLALVALGAWLFGGTAVLGYRALAVAAALFGLDMLVTGAVGFCPLYYKLGRRGLPSRSGLA